jgi:hypothetical protein
MNNDSKRQIEEILFIVLWVLLYNEELLLT